MSANETETRPRRWRSAEGSIQAQCITDAEDCARILFFDDPVSRDTYRERHVGCVRSPRSSRASHALANRQSRITVCGET